METLVSLCIGLGLSAACGLRVFIPLLVMSLATRAGLIEPASGFAWLGSWAAIIAFGSACVLEIGGYYIPWLDHVLDTIATPAAAIAGTIATAAQIDAMHPLISWAMALIAGGGLASVVQVGTVATRGTSTVTTVGVANPIVSTIENAASTVLSVLAVLVPALLGAGVVILLGVWARRKAIKWLERRRAAKPATAAVA